MKAVRLPTAAIHRCTAPATSSGRVSERIQTRDTAQHEQVCQDIGTICRGERALDPDSQALPGKLV